MSTRKAKEKKAPVGKSLHDIEVAEGQEARDLRARAMLVRCPMACWSGQGRDNAVTNKLRTEAEATGRVGVFVKEYMDRSYLSEINQIIQTARTYNKVITMPWGDDQRRLLPAISFFAYKKQMTGYQREFELRVDKFFAGYREAVLAQKKRLVKMWNANDYPSEESLRSRFRFQVYVEPIPTSDDFRVSLSGEETADIKREYDAEVRARLRGAVQDVFSNIGEVVAELREKLADQDAEIRSSSFAALKRLVASLPQLNSVVQDPNITLFAKKLAEDLLVSDTDAVAHDARVRSATTRKADALLAALKPLQGVTQ